MIQKLGRLADFPKTATDNSFCQDTSTEKWYRFINGTWVEQTQTAEYIVAREMYDMHQTRLFDNACFSGIPKQQLVYAKYCATVITLLYAVKAAPTMDIVFWMGVNLEVDKLFAAENSFQLTNQ